MYALEYYTVCLAFVSFSSFDLLTFFGRTIFFIVVFLFFAAPRLICLFARARSRSRFSFFIPFDFLLFHLSFVVMVAVVVVVVVVDSLPLLIAFYVVIVVVGRSVDRSFHTSILFSLH